MLPEKTSSDETIQIRCSPDLITVVKDCANAFMLENEGTKVSVEPLEGDIGEWIGESGRIALVTKSYMTGVDPRTTRVNVIGREVYVPVMNPGNRYLEEIMKQGISPAEFASLYGAGESKTWGTVLQNSSSAPVAAYRISDPSFNSYLSDFTNTGEASIFGNILGSCEEVVDRVKNEVNAVGFCTLTQLLEMERTKSAMEVMMIPVDLNDNGKLDHFEEIYGSVDELARGVWIGKYSGTLYSRIFAVTPLDVSAGAGMELLSWMLGNGQDLLAENGYAPLMERERDNIIASLYAAPVVTSEPEVAPKLASPLVLIILALIAGVIIVYLVLRVFNSREPLPEQRSMVKSTTFVSESSEVPGGYFFDRSHTWTFMEKDGRIRVGLDCFLQKITGTITKVDMKSPGEKVKKGETVFAIIQNGKRLQVKSPVTGIVREQNAKLLTNASLVNTEPFAEGWVYLVEPTKWMEEFSAFMSGQKYKDWIRYEFVRLKDFLAEVLQPKSEHAIVLQDGGEVQDGVLKDFGPEVWEDFQSGFLKN
jgi:glycine cleavage system H lipoate-binding protein